MRLGHSTPELPLAIPSVEFRVLRGRGLRDEPVVRGDGEILLWTLSFFEEADRGEFATDAEITEAWKKLGP